MSNENTQPTEADALDHLTDLVLVEPDQRAEPAERYEQLKQAWKEYLETPGEKEKHNDQIQTLTNRCRGLPMDGGT